MRTFCEFCGSRFDANKMHICTNVPRDLSSGTTTTRRSYSCPMLDTIGKDMMEPAADIQMMNASFPFYTSHVSAGNDDDGADNVSMQVDDSAVDTENIFMMQQPIVGSFDNLMGNDMTGGEAGLHKCISQSLNTELNVTWSGGTPIPAFNLSSQPDLAYRTDGSESNVMLRHGAKRTLDVINFEVDNMGSSISKKKK